MISPLQQGQLDHLCGVYAVINAVNYVLGPLRKPQLHNLFADCLQHLNHNSALLDRITTTEISSARMKGLLTLVRQTYDLEVLTPFRRQTALGYEQFWSQCQAFFDAEDARDVPGVILVRLGGGYPHWSLIQEMTEQRLSLFDSSGLKTVYKRHGQLATSHPQRPHQFYPKDTAFIRRSKTLKSVSGFLAGEQPGEYVLQGPITEDVILGMAQQLISQKFARGQALDNPHRVREYLPVHLALLEHETFWALFLDNQHRVIIFEQLFTGTIDQASVYPREVVKRGLQLNAKAVIFAHNHPSGNSTPSQSDKVITQKLKDALALVDITVLDHLVVGADEVTSLAELGCC